MIGLPNEVARRSHEEREVVAGVIRLRQAAEYDVADGWDAARFLLGRHVADGGVLLRFGRG
ncbi:hypothetical protein D3C72_1986820 [compost metagenome]